MPATRSPHVPRDVSATPDAVGEKLGELYARHGRMVLGVCRLMVRDPDEAEDAAQQTFLSAYAAMLEGTTPRDPAAWLGTIARNECRSRVRARTRAPLALTDDGPPAPDSHSIASGREDVETVLRALSQLSERQRDAVILRSVYGLSYRDVAKALGTSVAGVETLLFRGRRRLSDIARPQLAAAHALLVVPLTLKADLARLIPGFEMGAASAGGRAIGIAGGAAGLGIVGTVGGGGSGITGLLGAPIAARIVGVVTAATIGIAAAPTLQGPDAQDSLRAAGSEGRVAMTGPSRSNGPAAREAPPARGQGAGPVRSRSAATTVDGSRSSTNVVPSLVAPPDLTGPPATLPPAAEHPADPSDPGMTPGDPIADDSQPPDAGAGDGERAKEKKRRNRPGRHRGESRPDESDGDEESRVSESEGSRTDDGDADDSTSGDSRSDDSKTGDSESTDQPKGDEPTRDEPAPDKPKNDAPATGAPTIDETPSPPKDVTPAENPTPAPAPPPVDAPAPDPAPTDTSPLADPATSAVPEPSLVTADIIASSGAAAI